jgi:hypothetical protein
MDNFGQTVDKGKYSNIELAIKDINSAQKYYFLTGKFILL